MRFTEADTGRFYDSEDTHYRSFWDREGSLHWGYFDDLGAGDFVGACRRWTEMMIARAKIHPGARVLDVGCGNGTTAMAIGRETGAAVTGIDLSAVRVTHAVEAVRRDVGSPCHFLRASATALPFADAAFSHVWSQAVLYHVHDRSAALSEIHRVLRGGGIFVFDDLVTPTRSISVLARTYVYDRLLFEPGPSAADYARRQHGIGHPRTAVRRRNLLRRDA